MNTPLIDRDKARRANRNKIVIDLACPHCRQLTGHASSCLTLFDAQIAAGPCWASVALSPTDGVSDD